MGVFGRGSIVATLAAFVLITSLSFGATAFAFDGSDGHGDSGGQQSEQHDHDNGDNHQGGDQDNHQGGNDDHGDGHHGGDTNGDGHHDNGDNHHNGDGDNDTDDNNGGNVTPPVTLLNQTIDFGALADKILGDADFGVAATASSGLPVNFTASGPCLFNVGTDILHITDIGTCAVTAHQPGDATYNPAEDVVQSFNITAPEVIPPTPEPAHTGTLVIKKVVVNTGGGTATPDQFSFSLNGATSTPFDADGENDLAVATGTYSIVEDATSTYSAAYSGCSEATVAADATTTCTITNTFIAPAATTTATSTDTTEGNGGGNGGGGSSSSNGNGGGGSNGPIAGSLSGPVGPTSGNAIIPSGSVLGASIEPKTCAAYLTAYIRKGAKNDSEQVMRLQKFLNQFENESLTVNGQYDDATLAAVNRYQAKYADDVLTPWGYHAPTGFVYYTTQHAINNAYCKGISEFPLTDAQKEEINEFAHRSTSHPTHYPSINASTEQTLEPHPTPTSTSPLKTTKSFWQRIGDFFRHN